MTYKIKTQKGHENWEKFNKNYNQNYLEHCVFWLFIHYTTIFNFLQIEFIQNIYRIIQNTSLNYSIIKFSKLIQIEFLFKI